MYTMCSAHRHVDADCLGGIGNLAGAAMRPTSRWAAGTNVDVASGDGVEPFQPFGARGRLRDVVLRSATETPRYLRGDGALARLSATIRVDYLRRRSTP
jgi:hypothetical protein